MDYNYHDFNKEETIILKKFIFKILLKWHWFVISLAMAYAIAFLLNKYSSPQYKVYSSILIKEKSSELLGGVENIIEDLGFTNRRRKRNVINEIDILKSYYLNNQAINELDFRITYVIVGRIRDAELYTSSPFVVDLDTSEYQLKNHQVFVTILSEDEYRLEIDENINVDKVLKFGEQFVHELLNFNIAKRKDIFKINPIKNKYYFIINDLNSLTNRYKSKIGISVNDKKGSVLYLTLQGEVPKKEADYLNKIGEVYVRSGLEEKNKIAENTINFIEDQLNNITDSLEIVENNLQNFRQSNKIIDISREGTALFEKVEQLQTEKALIKIQGKYYEYLLHYVQSRNNFKDVIVPSIMGINDQVLNSLVGQLIQLYTEKGEIAFSATEDNPTLDVVNHKIQITRDNLIENVNNLIKTTSEISLTEINRRIGEVDVEIKKLPITERQLINIQRKFNLNDEIYTYMLQKKAEAGIAKASNIADNKILDRARVDNAILVSPNGSLNITISLILGLLVPLVFIILIDFFNNRITERKDIEALTSVPILGVVGHNDKDTELIVSERPKSSLSESFRTIRTNLQYMLARKDSNIISLCSTISGEGKTFCAINLATIIAMSNKKTLLLGLDLRKPKLHKEFNLDNDVGISSYLIGKNTFDEIISQTNIENLDIVTSGPIPPNPSELLETDTMRELLIKLKKEYEFIIIDTPPIALVTDALLISRYADINIFVVRQNFSNKGVISFIDDLYAGKKVEDISILINDIKAPIGYGYRKYGYKYGYGYSYGYGYGYGLGYGYGYYDEDKNLETSFIKRSVNSITSLFRNKKS